MNLNIFKTFWLVLAITAGLSLTNTATAQQYALCDLNRDGNVDFADFIFFTEHFGKAMFDQPLAEVITVRDTVIITNEQDQTAGIKLGQVFGYWMVSYKIPNHLGRSFDKEKKDAFLFHHTNGPDENTVYGKSINHNIVAPFADTEMEAKITYLPDEDKYILTDKAHMGFGELEYNLSKSGMNENDLEIKFSIEYEIRDDMSHLLNSNTYKTPESISYTTINEPIVKVEYIRLLIKTENRVVDFEPIGVGLRPCNRDEYMSLSD